jgi:lipopolysaccharide assembly outer membrane protein LptD (OstA)
LRIASVKSLFILACLLITVVHNSYSQTVIQRDTTITFPADSSKQTATGDSFLDDKVNYKAEDSTLADMANKKAFLYNKAEVYYQDMILKAGYIEIDFEKKMVIAKGMVDSSGKLVQRPVFEQGPEKFTAGEITYNFETRKGKIKDVITQQGDGYIHGSDIKKDTNNMYYVAFGRYTTCDLEDEPHYYLQAKKIKVIPNDKIITGPAELYIADVPTPLLLPFGYFPNKKGRRSGLIMPGYGETARLGFFLSNGGFYYGGSEVFDLSLLGDIYSNGGFSARANSNYNKRYRYNGRATFSYGHLYTGSANPELAHQPIQNDFKLSWFHAQDAKAHPDSRFSADVNLGTSTFGRNNGSVNTDYINTTYSSNINYYKGFTGTPFTLNIGARHSQSILSRTIDILLPNIGVSMSRITPFKNNNRIGKRWYDQVGISADLQASNSISTYDTILYKGKNLEKKMQNGAMLRVPISTTFNILKYIHVTPSINTTTNLYLRTIRKRYGRDNEKFYQVYTDTVPTLTVSNEVRASTAFSTMLYGDYFFKAKHLKQIHHVVTPTMSLNFKPDYSQRQFGYYKSYTDSAGVDHEYSIFEGSMMGGPAAGREGSIGFSLNNTLEAKIKSDTDSGDVFKKLTLLDNLSASIAYNAAVKQFNWSPLGIAARTRLFNKLDITSSAVFDPYRLKEINGTMQRVNQLLICHGGIARLTNASASVSTSLRSKDKSQVKNTSEPNVGAAPPPATLREELQYINDNPNAYIDFNVPWNLNIGYNINYTPVYKSQKEKEKEQLSGVVSAVRPFTQSLSFSGDVSVTKSWKVNISSGYDFITNKLTLTSINIYRDLHCWELHFNWVPFGYRQSFLLEINVKSSMLRDLKLKKQSLNNNAVGY